MGRVSFEQMQQAVGLRFANPKLLEQALTHRSRGDPNYERLEFLGDSVLGLVVADHLYHRFPDVSEGKLSRMRSYVVRKETLARVARDMELPDLLNLGEGELKSGGFNRDSILSDSLEAIIGAVYLDQGIEATQAFIHHYFETVLESLTVDTVYKDPKSRLQEYLQHRGQPIPVYEIVAVTGEPHNQIFEIACGVTLSPTPYKATGTSRRAAEQRAAIHALNALTNNE